MTFHTTKNYAFSCFSLKHILQNCEFKSLIIEPTMAIEVKPRVFAEVGWSPKQMSMIVERLQMRIRNKKGKHENQREGLDLFYTPEITFHY